MKKIKYSKLIPQKPIKHFTLKFLITLIMGLASSFLSIRLVGFNPIFNAACGMAVSGIFMIVFDLIKE